MRRRMCWGLGSGNSKEKNTNECLLLYDIPSIFAPVLTDLSKRQRENGPFVLGTLAGISSNHLNHPLPVHLVFFPVTLLE